MVGGMPARALSVALVDERSPAFSAGLLLIVHGAALGLTAG
jgi:hypothetical protein